MSRNSLPHSAASGSIEGISTKQSASVVGGSPKGSLSQPFRTAFGSSSSGGASNASDASNTSPIHPTSEKRPDIGWALPTPMLGSLGFHQAAHSPTNTFSPLEDVSYTSTEHPSTSTAATSSSIKLQTPNSASTSPLVSSSSTIPASPSFASYAADVSSMSQSPSSSHPQDSVNPMNSIGHPKHEPVRFSSASLDSSSSEYPTTSVHTIESSQVKSERSSSQWSPMNIQTRHEMSWSPKPPELKSSFSTDPASGDGPPSAPIGSTDAFAPHKDAPFEVGEDSTKLPKKSSFAAYSGDISTESLSKLTTPSSKSSVPPHSKTSPLVFPKNPSPANSASSSAASPSSSSNSSTSAPHPSLSVSKQGSSLSVSTTNAAKASSSPTSNVSPTASAPQNKAAKKAEAKKSAAEKKESLSSLAKTKISESAPAKASSSSSSLDAQKSVSPPLAAAVAAPATAASNKRAQGASQDSGAASFSSPSSSTSAVVLPAYLAPSLQQAPIVLSPAQVMGSLPSMPQIGAPAASVPSQVSAPIITSPAQVLGVLPAFPGQQAQNFQAASPIIMPPPPTMVQLPSIVQPLIHSSFVGIPYQSHYSNYAAQTESLSPFREISASTSSLSMSGIFSQSLLEKPGILVSTAPQMASSSSAAPSSSSTGTITSSYRIDLTQASLSLGDGKKHLVFVGCEGGASEELITKTVGGFGVALPATQKSSSTWKCGTFVIAFAKKKDALAFYGKLHNYIPPGTKKLFKCELHSPPHELVAAAFRSAGKPNPLTKGGAQQTQALVAQQAKAASSTLSAASSSSSSSSSSAPPAQQPAPASTIQQKRSAATAAKPSPTRADDTVLSQDVQDFLKLGSQLLKDCAQEESPFYAASSSPYAAASSSSSAPYRSPSSHPAAAAPHYSPSAHLAPASSAAAKKGKVDLKGTLPSFGGVSAPTSAMAKRAAKPAAAKVVAQPYASSSSSSSSSSSPSSPLPSSSSSSYASVSSQARTQQPASTPPSKPSSSVRVAPSKATPTETWTPAYTKSGIKFDAVRHSECNKYYQYDHLLQDEETECHICLEEFLRGQVVCTLVCFCRVHQRCIDNWFDHKKSGTITPQCPTHRTAYIEAGLIAPEE